jgi:hypothetical protein
MNLIKSAGVIVIVLVLAIVIIFRDKLLDLSLYFLIVLLTIVLLFILFGLFRLMVFITPSLIHFIRIDLIKVGLLNKLEITGRMDKSLLLEERFSYCKNEFSVLESSIEKALLKQSAEANLKLENIHVKRYEIENKISEQIKNLKSLIRELSQIELECKNLVKINSKDLVKNLIKKSLNVLIPIAIIVLIPAVIYLIYFLLKLLSS